MPQGYNERILATGPGGTLVTSPSITVLNEEPPTTLPPPPGPIPPPKPTAPPRGGVATDPKTPAGTLISTYCLKPFNLMGTYADGAGGSYNGLIEANSVRCGYTGAVPPPPPVSPPPPPSTSHPKPGAPPPGNGYDGLCYYKAGQVLSTYCKGADYYKDVADGMCGYTTELVIKDDPSCIAKLDDKGDPILDIGDPDGNLDPNLYDPAKYPDLTGSKKAALQKEVKDADANLAVKKKAYADEPSPANAAALNAAQDRADKAHAALDDFLKKEADAAAAGGGGTGSPGAGNPKGGGGATGGGGTPDPKLVKAAKDAQAKADELKKAADEAQQEADDRKAVAGDDYLAQAKAEQDAYLADAAAQVAEEKAAEMRKKIKKKQIVSNSSVYKFLL
jgi:hypothetical protein